MTQPLSRSLVVVAVALLSGCSAFHVPVEEPTVQVRGVAVGAVSLTGIDGRVDLDLYNPNPVGLPLERVDWRLEVAGGRLVEGSTRLSNRLPARGTTPVSVGLHIDMLDAAIVAPRLAGGDDRYALQGTLHFATAVGDLAVSFRHEGTFADQG